MNISQSQISLYRFCPHAYEQSYRFDHDAIMFNPAVMEVGRRVHDAIDHYYRHHYSSNLIEEDILSRVYGVLRAEWDITLPADYLKKAYTCLQNFAKFEIQNITEGVTTKPLTEVKIPADGMYGIVDYVDLNRPKVVDFKTNAYASVGYENKMQATVYKILVRHRFNIELDEFTFEFLYPGNNRTVRFAGKEMESIEQEVINYKNKIQESWKTLQFPKEPRTPSSCRNCDYKFYCGGI